MIRFWNDKYFLNLTVTHQKKLYFYHYIIISFFTLTGFLCWTEENKNIFVLSKVFPNSLSMFHFCWQHIDYFCYFLQSIDKISKVTSPVLVIHGTEDEVIDFSHGLALYERCQRPVEPLWVEGAGHNDVELYGQYLERLKQFVSHELANL